MRNPFCFLPSSSILGKFLAGQRPSFEAGLDGVLGDGQEVFSEMQVDGSDDDFPDFKNG